jgi:hypothetical protein
VTPVVGTVLAAALVVIVSSSVTVVALDMGSQLPESPPTTTFDTELDENITVRHAGGDTIDGDRIEVRGGESIAVPNDVQSGDAIEVVPYGNESEIELIWDGERSSARLARVDIVESYRNQPSSDAEEPDTPALGGCQFGTEPTVDGAGDCVVVFGPIVDSVTNASEVVLLPNAEVETVTDTADVTLFPNAQITDEVDVRNEIVVKNETGQITGTVTGGTIVEYS